MLFSAAFNVIKKYPFGLKFPIGGIATWRFYLEMLHFTWFLVDLRENKGDEGILLGFFPIKPHSFTES